MSDANISDVWQQAEDNHRRYSDTGDHESDIRFLALGLTGEAGELANFVKKRWRDGDGHDEAIRYEIADVCAYAFMLAGTMGMSPADLIGTIAEKQRVFLEKMAARAAPKVARCTTNDHPAMGRMTDEAEGMAMMLARYEGQVISFDVREPYYLASCDVCGWVGSSELCPASDEDAICPRCYTTGADCGQVADALTRADRNAADIIEAHAHGGIRQLYDKVIGNELIRCAIGTECKCGWSFAGSDEQEVRAKWAAHVATALAFPTQPATPYDRRLLELAESDVIPGDDGLFIFWPTESKGAYNARNLRTIADELDRRNAGWEKQLAEGLSA